MAAPTSASKGMWSAVAVLGILTLGLIILSVISVANVQRLKRELAQAQSDLDNAVRVSERGDRWEELKIASDNQNQGAVAYLDSQLQNVMVEVTGVRRKTVTELQEQITNSYGADAPPLLDILSQQDSRIDALDRQVARVETQRDDAITERDSSRDRIAELQRDYGESIARAEAEVGDYSQRVQTYRSDVEQTKDDLETRVSGIRDDADTRVGSLEGEIDQLTSENLILQDQIARLRRERSDETLQPEDEFALVDGRVVGVNSSTSEVYIDKGRNDRLVQGLTFEVYPTGTVIRADAEGNFPQGKATIEVVRIEDSSAVCFVLRNPSGNPILRDDLIANAVYDPDKRYSFTVFGNFDTNGDNFTTPEERLDIEALIQEWGGTVSNEISGDTDFVVLGRKPILPPQPSVTDPAETVAYFFELRNIVNQYESIFEKASQTNIPVLNQNRLYTLTGLSFRR